MNEPHYSDWALTWFGKSFAASLLRPSAVTGTIKNLRETRRSLGWSNFDRGTQIVGMTDSNLPNPNQFRLLPYSLHCCPLTCGMALQEGITEHGKYITVPYLAIVMRSSGWSRWFARAPCCLPSLDSSHMHSEMWTNHAALIEPQSCSIIWGFSVTWLCVLLTWERPFCAFPDGPKTHARFVKPWALRATTISSLCCNFTPLARCNWHLFRLMGSNNEQILLFLEQFSLFQALR